MDRQEASTKVTATGADRRPVAPVKRLIWLSCAGLWLPITEGTRATTLMGKFLLDLYWFVPATADGTRAPPTRAGLASETRT
jgi:hypothetical protein